MNFRRAAALTAAAPSAANRPADRWAAAWRVWRVVGTLEDRALGVYGAQLALNLIWAPLFFALERRGLALIDILALDVLVALTLVLFWRRDRLAGALLIPYLGWVLFATALNASILWLN